MSVKKICSTCVFSEKVQSVEYPFCCKKHSKDIHIAHGYGIEVMPGKKADDSCGDHEFVRGVIGCI